MQSEQHQDTINQRIALLIKTFANGNQKRFAESIGIVPSAISGLFGKRQSKPGLDMLQRIAKAHTSVSMDWLINGTGEMLRPEKERGFGADYTNIRDLHTVLQDEDQSITFGQRLSYVRRIRNLSVEDVAKAIGLPTEHVEDMEATGYTFNKIDEIAELYQMPKNFLELGDTHGHLTLRALAETQADLLERSSNTTNANESGALQELNHRLQQLIREYMQAVKYSEEIKEEHYHSAEHIDSLNSTIDSLEKAIPLQRDRLSSIQGPDWQQMHEFILSSIEKDEARLVRNRSRYEAFLPRHTKLTDDLRRVNERRAKLEEELAKLTSSE